jgi:hypothetical protein
MTAKDPIEKVDETSSEQCVDGGADSDTSVQEIPWLNIVQFHKEIVARAEDQFFALEGDNASHARWTSLATFNPLDSTGAWEINLNDLKSGPFRQNLSQGNHESYFIGAACYRSDIKVNRDWVPRWVPLLYREIGIREDEGVLQVNPLAGAWSLSPLFLDLLRRLEINPPEDLIQTLIGQVLNDQTSFSDQIFCALFQLYPDLRRELTKPIPLAWGDAPSSWVLFSPTAVF